MSSKKHKKLKVPISAWSCFVDEHKPLVQAQYPNESKMEICHKLQEIWTNAEDEFKKKYQKKAQCAYRLYARSQKKLDKDSDNVDNNDEDDDIKSKKKKIKVPAYSLFVEEKQNQLKNECPTMSLKERAELIASMWNNLSQKDKIPYINLSKKATRKISTISYDEYYSDFNDSYSENEK